MSDIAIKFENISKQYRLGEIGTGTLSHDLNRWWHKVRGKEDPYLKIGQESSLSSLSAQLSEDYVWALRDIKLEVKQGEVLGIIGKNGAGKSTLLKILSKVTRPTTGIIKTRGRIASLLEVGTGFHPEMTGRENIYMNGSIMGMTRVEITRKFDEIVDFAGVEKYIDTPVKRYSSGMMVRLGFAIAAHLEPEILVVDEVLAVGDSEFQKKAISKMEDVTSHRGRTILFVSHNMGAVRNLCSNGIVLQNGLIGFEGEMGQAVDHYLCNSKLDLIKKTIISQKHRKLDLSKDVELIAVELINETEIATNEPIQMKMTLKKNNMFQNQIRVVGMLNNSTGIRIGLFFSDHFDLPQTNDQFDIILTLNNHNLAKGQYWFDFNIGTGTPSSGLTDFDLVYNVISFEVIFDDYITKSHIVKWATNWGNICFKQVDIKML
jgi:lipopolysaccharide transport system ATP-binding protein